MVLKDLNDGFTVITEGKETEPEFVELGQEEEKKEELKNIIKKYYTDFTELNNKEIDYLIHLVDESPQAFKILLFIIQNMDSNNVLVCTYKVLEERFGISHTAVWRHIKYLKDNGCIVVQKTRTANAYILTPDLTWESCRKNMA